MRTSSIPYLKKSFENRRQETCFANISSHDECNHLQCHILRRVFCNLRAQARNLPIWCAIIWSNCKCAFPLCHLLSRDLRFQLRICALSHATSPPGVNTTLTRASHSDRHTGKLARTISILHLVFQLSSYLIAALQSCSICQTFEKLT